MPEKQAPPLSAVPDAEGYLRIAADDAIRIMDLRLRAIDKTLSIGFGLLIGVGIVAAVTKAGVPNG